MMPEKDSSFDAAAQKNDSVADNIPQDKDSVPDDASMEQDDRVAESERRISILKESIAGHRKTAVWSFFVALISGGITYAIIASDGFSAGIWVFITLFCIGLCLYELFKIAVGCRRLRAKELELKTLGERVRYDRRRKKRIAAGILLLAAVCAVAFAVRQRQAMIAVYEQAETLIDEGSFEEAAGLLKQIEEKDYQDTKALLKLCEAHKDFDKGYYTYANSDLYSVKFRYQTAERLAVIDTFREELAVKYEEQLKEIEARKKKNEEEKKQKEAEEALSRKKETDAWVPIPTSGGSGSKNKSSYDDYYADEFADAEDFYDWYAEDFDSYEDAEDYYNSHVG